MRGERPQLDQEDGRDLSGQDFRVGRLQLDKNGGQDLSGQDLRVRCCPFLFTLLTVSFTFAMSQSDDTMHVLSANGRIGFMSGPLTKAQMK
jgi:hypothetical protein